MIQRSSDYLIWDEKELDYEKAARYFAGSPYGIIYIKDKSKTIIGIITTTEVVKGMQTGCLTYNSSFVCASSAERAIETIKGRLNIHVVPVLDKNGEFIEQYQESYEIPARFVNGILLKLENDENGDYASILKDLDINEVRLIISADSDAELVEQVKNRISERNIDVNITNFMDFLKSHIFNRDDTNVLWVDTGADYLSQRLRKYCWARVVDDGVPDSRYLFLKDFMNFVNVSVVSAVGYEKYIRNIMQIYPKAAIYAPKKISEKIRKIIDIEDVTESLHIRMNYRNERVDCWNAESDGEYDIILFFDLINTDNLMIYLNGYFMNVDQYFINCEYYLEKKLFQNYLPIFEKNDMKVFFLQLSGYKQIMSAAKISYMKYFQGNLANQTVGNSENDVIKFLAYDRQTGFELYHEIIGDAKTIKHMKNMRVGDIYYSIERNPAQIFHNDRKSIHVFGCCLTNGTFVKDDDTIAAIIKKKYPEWNVYNHGSLCVDLLETLQYYGHFKKGDILIIMPTLISSIYDEFYSEHKNKIIDFSKAYLGIPNLYDKIWQVPLHCNHVVVRHIAEYVIEQMERADDLDSYMCGEREEISYYKNNKQYLLKNNSDNDLETYANSLKRYKKEGINGAVVMNCNPFTKGHRYLIEQAADRVDNLYVFVVEEDKSYFSFKDRFLLVKQGCSDLENVTIIPSGKYIISALTMPGYFEKDELQDTILDASSDLEIFADIIAPGLNIKKRFVGTEPIDKYTRQYNYEMQRILPQKGIKVVEIKRAELNNSVISASKVRELLEQKQFDKVKELVPECTFRFLEDRFK